MFQVLGLAPNGNGFEGRALTEILAASGDRGDPNTASKAHTLDLAGRSITLRQRFVDGHAYLDMTSGP